MGPALPPETPRACFRNELMVKKEIYLCLRYRASMYLALHPDLKALLIAEERGDFEQQFELAMQPY